MCLPPQTYVSAPADLCVCPRRPMRLPPQTYVSAPAYVSAPDVPAPMCLPVLSPNCLHVSPMGLPVRPVSARLPNYFLRIGVSTFLFSTPAFPSNCGICE
jgi:hypothetical protein